jgi:hypothetical protein
MRSLRLHGDKQLLTGTGNVKCGVQINDQQIYTLFVTKASVTNVIIIDYWLPPRCG